MSFVSSWLYEKLHFELNLGGKVRIFRGLKSFVLCAPTVGEAAGQ